MLFNCYKFFMKIKNLFIALSAMALATGCSNDEMTEKNMGNTIDFSVVAGKMSRATATTTNSINQFKVWAFIGDDAYMNGVEVKKGEGGAWTYSNTKFWPEAALDFFAVSPMSVSFDATNKKINNYVVLNGKEDLLYAANYQEKKADHLTDKVAVNFRHALSQIVFAARNSNTDNIKVEVKEIRIDGIANMGTLSWATETTHENLTGAENDTEVDATWGTWSTPTGNTYYTITFDTPQEITADGLNFQNEALFLMPQKLNEWLDADGKVAGTARLLIKCRITQTSADGSNLQVWPAKSEVEDDNFAYVAISLVNPNSDPNMDDSDEESIAKHNRWMQGKKYTYTLIFGEGAGYKPEVGEGEDPEPVLVPIKFEVTVDEFQNGGSYDADGKTK